MAVKPRTISYLEYEHNCLNVRKIRGSMKDVELIATVFFKRAGLSITSLFKEEEKTVYEIYPVGHKGADPLYVIYTHVEISKTIKNTGVKAAGVSYYVRVGDSSGYLAPDGYTAYLTRWQADAMGLLPAGEQVYGYEQALAHIEQVRHESPSGTKFSIDVINTSTFSLEI